MTVFAVHGTDDGWMISEVDGDHFIAGPFDDYLTAEAWIEGAAYEKV